MDEPAVNPVAFAIPIFLLSIAIETAIARQRGRRSYYCFGTALSDVATGLVFQSLEVFFKLILPLVAFALAYLASVFFSTVTVALIGASIFALMVAGLLAYRPTSS